MSAATTEQASLERPSQLRLHQSVATAPSDGVEAFLGHFPSEDACLEFVKEAVWPGGVTRCARCKRRRKHHRVNGRKAYACNRCGNHIYPLRGTVFAKSSTPLTKWFHTMCLMASTRRTVTARRIQREIGVTYKTAWRMRHRIRIALDSYERQEPTHALLSQEVTCLEGIRFISTFLRGYLRMCRDV